MASSTTPRLSSALTGCPSASTAESVYVTLSPGRYCGLSVLTLTFRNLSVAGTGVFFRISERPVVLPDGVRDEKIEVLCCSAGRYPREGAYCVACRQSVV